MNANDPAAARHAGNETGLSDVQAVVFCLGEDRFALPVDMVREILDHRACSPLPGAPEWMLGLIDVRGQSVPLVDLRTRLGLMPVAATLASRILVVEVHGPGQNGSGVALVLGLVVDRVLDVCGFSGAAIESVPEIGSRWHREFIRAVLRREDTFIVLLDSDRVLGGDGDYSLFAGLDIAA